MHSRLDQLPVDAEGDEVFVHTYIYRHAPRVVLFHKARAQFYRSGFNLCVQLARLNSLLDQL